LALNLSLGLNLEAWSLGLGYLSLDFINDYYSTVQRFMLITEGRRPETATSVFSTLTVLCNSE